MTNATPRERWRVTQHLARLFRRNTRRAGRPLTVAEMTPEARLAFAALMQGSPRSALD
jgi:hypothetical protein